MRWSDHEINYLINNYVSLSLEDLALKLNKTRKSIFHKAARLGLSRERVPHNKPKDPSYRKNVDKKYYENNKDEIYKRKRKRLYLYKKNLIDFLGGKCSKCGYNSCPAALDFHHVNGIKENVVTKLINDSAKEKALKEAKKCILLCANCHRETHYKGP